MQPVERRERKARDAIPVIAHENDERDIAAAGNMTCDLVRKAVITPDQKDQLGLKFVHPAVERGVAPVRRAPYRIAHKHRARVLLPAELVHQLLQARRAGIVLLHGHGDVSAAQRAAAGRPPQSAP